MSAQTIAKAIVDLTVAAATPTDPEMKDFRQIALEYGEVVLIGESCTSTLDGVPVTDGNPTASLIRTWINSLAVEIASVTGKGLDTIRRASALTALGTL